jgi:trimeric autotransporter adhesin
VAVNAAGLAVGTYEGIITITPIGTQFQPAGPPVQIAVGLTVTNSSIVNQIVSSGARFYPGSPQSDTFSITPDQLTGPFAANVFTDSGGNWLSATPVSGTTPAQITVTASSGSLAPGVYSGVVTVQGANGGIFAIPTMLTVPGGLQLLPQNPVVFTMGPGESTPAPQTFPIPVGCLGSCGSPPSSPPKVPPFQTAVSTHSGGNWLSATPAVAGTAVTVSVNPAGLTPGVYAGVVTLTSTGSPTAQIPVALSLWTGPTPALVASPPAITVSAALYSTQPLTAGVEILAGYRQAALSARATTSSGGNWLTVGVVSSTPGSVQLWFDSSNLAAGVYNGDVTVSAQGQMLDIPVTLTVGQTSGVPPPWLGSVLNAASGIQGAIAPGEIISIQGFSFSGPVFVGGGGVLSRPRVSSTMPTSVGGVAVLINGQPAPLLYEGRHR